MGLDEHMASTKLFGEAASVGASVVGDEADAEVFQGLEILAQKNIYAVENLRAVICNSFGSESP